MKRLNQLFLGIVILANFAILPVSQAADPDVSESAAIARNFRSFTLIPM